MKTEEGVSERISSKQVRLTLSKAVEQDRGCVTKNMGNTDMVNGENLERLQLVRRFRKEDEG